MPNSRVSPDLSKSLTWRRPSDNQLRYWWSLNHLHCGRNIWHLSIKFMWQHLSTTFYGTVTANETISYQMWFLRHYFSNDCKLEVYIYSLQFVITLLYLVAKALLQSYLEIGGPYRRENSRLLLLGKASKKKTVNLGLGLKLFCPPPPSEIGPFIFFSLGVLTFNGPN